MNLVWNPTDPQEWGDFHRRHHGSLQQSWNYGEALIALGVQVHRVLLKSDGQLMAIAQLGARRWLGYLYLASCSRGPVWAAAVNGDFRRQFYRSIKRTLPAKPWRAVVFSPDCAPSEMMDPECADMSRVLTGYTTVLLDLTQPLPKLRSQLASKWRNRLHKSESDTNLQVFVEANFAQCEKLLAEEALQRRKRGFDGLPLGFVRAYIHSHDRAENAYVMAWAQQKEETMASVLVLLHGATATYHIGWANESGRKSNAHNLLLWRLIVHLKSLGIEKFDLGGINTDDLPGITRFKLGTGGTPLVLAGTYF